jgi:hypothetical protein
MGVDACSDAELTCRGHCCEQHNNANKNEVDVYVREA